MGKRPDWDEYFLQIAMLVATRSTCLRHKVGAVIVKDRQLLTSGYNGAAIGVLSCMEEGDCMRNALGIPSGQRHEICKAVHAEQNSIIQAGVHGVSIKDATMFCTHSPCMICAKMIRNARIKRLVTYADYADLEAKQFIMDNGIEFVKLNRPSTEIKFLD